MTWTRALPWIALLLVAGLVLGGVRLPAGLGLGDGAPALTPGGSAQASVVRVIDGDTIVVSLGGARQERVRYVGMDTPETVKPDTPVQCWGLAAHALNARLLAPGARVTLRFDRELRDRYGRLLAYVYRAADGLFVNAQLVRDGAARTLTIAPNTGHEAELTRLQAGAQAARRGLWGAC